MEEYLEEMTLDMNKAYEGMLAQFSKVRTGRASPQLVDSVSVMVAAYGSSMPLNQLATVQAPDARLLVITPWDKTTINDIERGIFAAGLGLNPSNDGQIIRVPVPPLTQERRQDLVRQVRKLVEDAKIRVRHVRREYNETFKGAQKDGEVSEDEERSLLARVQAGTDAMMKRLESACKEKEAEVLAV